MNYIRLVHKLCWETWAFPSGEADHRTGKTSQQLGAFPSRALQLLLQKIMYRRDLFPPPSSQNHSPEASRVDPFFFLSQHVRAHKDSKCIEKSRNPRFERKRAWQKLCVCEDTEAWKINDKHLFSRLTVGHGKWLHSYPFICISLWVLAYQYTGNVSINNYWSLLGLTLLLPFHVIRSLRCFLEKGMTYSLCLVLSNEVFHNKKRYAAV